MPDIVARLPQSYPWPPSTLKLFPPQLATAYQHMFTAPEQPDEADILSLTQQVENDYLQSRSMFLSSSHSLVQPLSICVSLFHPILFTNSYSALGDAALFEYFTRQNHHHTFLCVMFRLVFDNLSPLPSVYK
jgi:hypothetical protein